MGPARRPGTQARTPHRIQDALRLVKLSFGVVTGAGALVALVVAYRRQRVDEDGALDDYLPPHIAEMARKVAGPLEEPQPATA